VLEPWPLRHSLLVFLVGAGAALGVFALVYRATGGETTRDRVDVAIKAAAAVAAVAAGLLTWARLELSRHEHRLGVDRDLTERYGRAVDQLGSDDELIRVGGVFALERFALDAVRTDGSNDVDWRMARGVLAALARKDSARAAVAVPKKRGRAQASAVVPISALEAVQVLGRFVQRSGLQRTRMFGEALDLAGVIAPGAHLRGAYLVGAKLARADLTRADLGGADLTGANLWSANLGLVDLSGADLTGANLPWADFVGAKLARADLVDADLTGAKLWAAKLSGADLSGADLPGADLTNADLPGADLSGADLSGANLSGANLSDANLSDANLSRADMRGVRYDDTTVWPEGFDPPPRRDPGVR
jgi:uncharacterized protein YjbI with pentapeptide repeats